MMSNKGLNSKEALDESTATNSSVTLSGIRREKEAPTDLDITDYSRNPGKSEPPSPCYSGTVGYGEPRRTQVRGQRDGAAGPIRRQTSQLEVLRARIISGL